MSGILFTVIGPHRPILLLFSPVNELSHVSSGVFRNSVSEGEGQNRSGDQSPSAESMHGTAPVKSGINPIRA